jgi:hypothetical protein
LSDTNTAENKKRATRNSQISVQNLMKEKKRVQYILLVCAAGVVFFLQRASKKQKTHLRILKDVNERRKTYLVLNIMINSAFLEV